MLEPDVTPCIRLACVCPSLFVGWENELAFIGVMGVEGAGVCGGFSASVAGVELAPAPALEVLDFVGLYFLNQHKIFLERNG